MAHRLRPLLLLALLALEALTVVAVVLVTGASTRDLLIEQMRETTAIASAGLALRTVEVLDPAEQMARASAALLAEGVVPVDDDEAVLRYLDAQLGAARNVSGAYVGRPDGSFVLVSRNGVEVEGGTRVKVISVGPEGRRSVTVQRDADGTERSRVEEPEDRFDPRVRPWYVAAQAGGDVVWTEPYVFFGAFEPGITAASAVRAPDGTVQAVVGVDLSLADLSGIVADTTVSPGSLAALVDDGGQLVASTRLDQVVTDDVDGTRRRVEADEITEPALRSVIAGSLAGGGEAITGTPGAEVVPIEVGGEAWQLAVVDLPDEHPWAAAVAAPEAEFVAEVVAAQRRNALVAVGIALLVVVIALPLVSELNRRVEAVARRAATDPVTGLPNRRRFEELLEVHLATAHRRHRPLSVASIDLDHFKPVNDTWGHRVGDEVLAAVGGRLRNGLRDGDVVARVGGDEFAAILVDTPLDQAVDALERARVAVADRPAHTAKGDIGITVTIGVAQADHDEECPALLERSDAALYRAKQSGRNRVTAADGVGAARARP